MNKLEKVLDEIFHDERVKYYSPADAIFDEQYVRYDYLGGDRRRVVISAGSNDGEVRIKLFGENDANEMKTLLNLIFYT